MFYYVESTVVCVHYTYICWTSSFLFMIELCEESYFFHCCHRHFRIENLNLRTHLFYIWFFFSLRKLYKNSRSVGNRILCCCTLWSVFFTESMACWCTCLKNLPFGIKFEFCYFCDSLLICLSSVLDYSACDTTNFLSRLSLWNFMGSMFWFINSLVTEIWKVNYVPYCWKFWPQCSLYTLLLKLV